MIRRLLHHISRCDKWEDADDRGRFAQGANYDSDNDVRERLYPVHAGLANVVSSRIDELNSWDANGKVITGDAADSVMHAPVLDIDFPVFAIPSSTPGHFHLYIEKAIRWDDYSGLLDALAHCNIIESGYARACQERGATYVRMPTSKKPTREDPPRVTSTSTDPEPF